MNFNGFQSLVDRIEYELDAVLGLRSPKVAKLFLSSTTLRLDLPDFLTSASFSRLVRLVKEV
jgi:hypothetical protein